MLNIMVYKTYQCTLARSDIIQSFLSLRKIELIIVCAAHMANEEHKCTGHFTNYFHVASPSGHRQSDGLKALNSLDVQ